MRDERAFDGAEFLGLARRSRRDPYRLALFARHLEPDETASALLPVAGGTLVVTDRRLVVFSSHLEVDGAWNVREFAGYTVAKEIPLTAVVRVARSTRPLEAFHGSEDLLAIETAGGREEIVISRGAEGVVSEGDVSRLAELLTRSSPSSGPRA